MNINLKGMSEEELRKNLAEIRGARTAISVRKRAESTEKRIKSVNKAKKDSIDISTLSCLD